MMFDRDERDALMIELAYCKHVGLTTSETADHIQALFQKWQSQSIAALSLVSKILPSAAGLDDAPHSKVIACYMNMGELRAIKNAISTIPEAIHND